ncbi:DNA translocase FtsK [Oceanispirochaeta sp.]|uniref:DNA translocase FtsK n=1 Tax=Oceanispirochaeta sp. TaxID=2035350 RepID=UPI0026064E13|nr:DNA translocase FtsK [Oceanispirochaeta sp.]MDA3959122.1 DNA translocase FtsK [Oceanispirochaeta sp.]
MNKYARNLSIILAGTAGLLFFVIVLALFGVSAGGVSFLFRTFHLAAFYVPLYLAVCALILLKPRGMEKLLLTLNLSLLPFLNLALLLHVLSGNKSIFISRYLISELGAGLSVPFLLLLLLVECALIYKLVDFLFPDSSWFPIGRDISLWIKKKSHSLIESLPSHSFKDPIREEIYSKNPSEEGAEPGVGSFSIPDMPQPIPPVEIMDDSEIHDLIASVIKPDTSRKNGFNPNKTLSIDDVVNPIYEEGNSDSHTETADPPEDIVPVPDEDPGIEFLMDHEDSDLSASLENLEEDSQEDEDIQDEDYEEQGYITDRYEDLEALRDEPLLDDENPISIENKLYPEGESEKLGVLSPGMLPKHKRKKEYKVPVVGLLKEYPDDGFNEVDDFTRRQGRALEETLKEFKIEASIVGISRGPVITMFEIQPAPGVKVSSIVNLQDNLALRLAASRIRIVAPIPGKQAIGIEVPNKKRSIVSYSELVSSEEFTKADYEIPVILGKDISGSNQIIDLTRTPHLLIAGSTGSGKSVCVNSLICSILYQRSPREVKLIMVDPKIVELKLYNDIPHLLTPVITESKRAFQAVQWCLYEMERRYSLLDAMGVRDIKSFNKRIKERDIATTHLPYIVLVIDEFADLMATSGKELEAIVARLAAMSRAVGIHLVLATQRPSIDVITGLIKANFPSRIAFMVASKTDSRIIIDMMGAEKLLGKGDMLFTSAWDPFPSRVQGAFLSEDEVERVVSYVKTLGEPDYIDDEIFLDEDDFEGGSDSGPSSFSDPLYDKALDIVISAGKASASYLQRRLQIGYNRAARLVEEMEIRGIVGPQNGSKPREVVHIPDRPGSEMLNT